MMKTLMQQVAQQQEDNRTLLEDVERILAEMHKSQEATPSTVQSEILNNTISLGKCLKTTAPGSTATSN